MSIPANEQETSINYVRNDDIAFIYTSDTTVMTKLDKLVEESDDWKLDKEIEMKGEIVAKQYQCPKRLISYRSKITTKIMTEEQKRIVAERLKKLRKEGKLK